MRLERRKGLTPDVLASPLLASVPDLTIDGSPLHAEALARWDGLARLRRLELRDCEAAPAALALLLRAPGLAALRSLSLWLLEGQWTAALAASAGHGVLPALDDLEFCGPEHGEAVPVPPTGRLRRLRLRGAFEAGSFSAALASDAMSRLERLDLSGVRLDDGNLPARLAAARLPRLRSLKLDRSAFDRQDRGRVLASAVLAGLSHLWLNSWSFADAELAALTAHVAAPTSLVLHGCDLGDDAVARLARWPGLASCRVLDLSANRIGSRGLGELTDSPYAVGLRSLDLSYNPMRAPTQFRRLLASPLGQNLEELNVRGTSGTTAVAKEFAAAVGLTRLRELHLDGCNDRKVLLALRRRFSHLRCNLFSGP